MISAFLQPNSEFSLDLSDTHTEPFTDTQSLATNNIKMIIIIIGLIIIIIIIIIIM